MNQIDARKILSEILKQDKATLVSPTDGELRGRTTITYLCGNCGKKHSKSFSNLKSGEGGGLCVSCAQKRGNERRIASLKALPKLNVNKGETDFNRTLATETAAKDRSKLIDIYSKEENGSYTKINNDNQINRNSYLYIKCQCGEEDYINFRNAYGCGAKKPGEGLCLCAGCRKGHHSAALRKVHRGDDSTEVTVIESMSKRAERIEREGQECTDCKEQKQASEFFGLFNPIENCKVYKGRCYACSRKHRTLNRETALRNGSEEDFMKGELVIAKDRIKKHNKQYPDEPREFNITVPFLMELFERQEGKCAISGLPMLTTTHRDECPEGERCNPNKLSIDRIDSLRGYTEDNVQLVRWRANSMKMDMNINKYKEEILAQYEYLFGIQHINELVEN
jgi:hypothetical protein